MSRIGNNPVTVPAGVEVKIDGNTISAKGAKGELSTELIFGIKVSQEGDQLVFTRPNEDKKTKAAHGLIRSLVANTIKGVSDGFSKTLEVNGVGFKSAVNGKTLKLNLGFSHEINFEIPEDISVEAKNNVITVNGIDKQRVGQVAAQIRGFKKPEPYKGKGIKYVDEQIIRKAGKAAG